MGLFPQPTIDPTTGTFDPREFVFPDPGPLGAIIFLAVLMAVSTVALVFVFVRLIKFRNHRLIEPRCIGTMLPLQFVTYCNLVVFSLSIIMGKPPFCPAQDALNLAVAVMGLHYNFNIPTLVFQSDLNAMKLERGHSGKDTMVVKYLRLFSLPFRILYTFIASLLSVGLYFILNFYAGLSGDCNRESQLAVAIMALFIILVLFYFLVKLMKVEDPYYMKFENNLGSLGSLPQLFMMITYPIFPGIYGDWFDFRWVMIFTSVTNLFVDGLFSSLLTFDSFVLRLERLKGNLIPEDQIKEADTLGSIFALSQGMDLFQAILANPTMLEGFTKFTIKEWSVENVLFYKGVDEFKELFRREPKQGRTLASSLVQEYIVNGAPLEVNIEHQVRKQIIRELDEGLCETTFDQAQKSIYELMKKDTFEKWRKTGDFKEAIQALVTLRKSNQSDSKDGSRGSGSKVHSSSREQNQHRNEDSATEMTGSKSGEKF